MRIKNLNEFDSPNSLSERVAWMLGYQTARLNDAKPKTLSTYDLVDRYRAAYREGYRAGIAVTEWTEHPVCISSDMAIARLLGMCESVSQVMSTIPDEVKDSNAWREKGQGAGRVGDAVRKLMEIIAMEQDHAVSLLSVLLLPEDE